MKCCNVFVKLNLHWRLTWFHGCLVKVRGCLVSLSGTLDLVPWLTGEGSWLPRFDSCFPELCCMIEWWRFLVALISFRVPWTWCHGCLIKVTHSLDLLPWTCFHHCLVKVPGCLDSLPGLLDLVLSLLGEGFWLPGFGFLDLVQWCLVKISGRLDSLLGSLEMGQQLSGLSSWLPGFVSCSMYLVPWLCGKCSWLLGCTSWTWFHGCMLKDCDSLDLFA